MIRTVSLVGAAVVIASVAGCRSASDDVGSPSDPEQGAERGEAPEATPPTSGAGDESEPEAPPVAEREPERNRMIEEDIAGRGVKDPAVLRAMRAVPRHAFVPDEHAALAYADRPLPIGERQTISQPFVVAKMTELAALEPGDRVLEIGTGSGYQAAVLAEIAGEVYTIEIIRTLGERASETLKRLGYDNVHVRIGDGYAGWPEEAPFDAIVVTAAPPEIPQPLKDQLAVGGRMVAPVGTRRQDLRVFEKTDTGIEERSVFGVRFVPMTGEAQGE